MKKKMLIVKKTKDLSSELLSGKKRRLRLRIKYKRRNETSKEADIRVETNSQHKNIMIGSKFNCLHLGNVLVAKEKGKEVCMCICCGFMGNRTYFCNARNFIDVESGEDKRRLYEDLLHVFGLK